MDDARMPKRRRQDLILTEIRTSAAIRVSQLAKRLGVTGETIRRDLTELGAAGLLNRTYGGATISLITEPGIAQRNAINVDERRRIGRAAAQRIGSGKTVMIDGGSTTLQVVNALAEVARDLVLLTNSITVASAAAANPGFRVILCPGVYDRGEGSVMGEETVEFIARFNASIAVIGASGLTREGPCEAVSGAAAVKRAMIARVASAMLVIDASKFERGAFERVCAFDSIGEIVTDADPPSSIAKAVRAAGTVLTVA